MSALVIRNAALEKMAYVDEIESIAIIEGINREYELQAVLLVDEDKVQYITSDAIIEAEGNYFRIRSIEKQRWGAGQKRIVVQAEHVSYGLINHDLEYFTATGTPRAILNTLLAGTGFTVGDVEITGAYTVSIQEETNKRQVLLECARVFGGELEFDKFTIHLRQRRGEDTGIQIRLGKNLKAINRIEEEVDGQVWTAYEIDLVELVELYGPVEEIHLGDTIRLIDEEMGVNADHRVIWYSYNPHQKRVSRIQVANFVANLTDTLFSIRNEALQKEKLYNGIRIGPSVGFQAIRSDKRVRTTMNATEGISIERGPGDGSFPTRVFFVDDQGNVLFAGRLQGADGVFTGTLEAVDGVFKGTLEGVDGTFRGTLQAADGIFTGTLKAGRIDTARVVGENNQLLFGEGSSSNQFDGRIDYSGGRFRFQLNPGTYMAVDSGNRFMFYTGGTMNMALVETDLFPHYGLILGNVMVKGLDGSIQQIQIRNRTDSAYRPIAAADFIENSSREEKEGIRKCSINALEMLRKIPLYMYRYKEDNEEHIGMMYDEAPDVLKAGDGQLSVLNKLNLAIKAIQELADENERLRQEIEEMKMSKN